MTKLNTRPLRFLSCFLFIFTMLALATPQKLFGQLKEPEVRTVDDPISPYEQGFRTRFGISGLLNNFGFGVNFIYSRAMAPFTELTLTAGITGVRDASSQKFINYFTGRKVSPNRYKRALAFPIMVGIERRIFPHKLADNFRLFVSADAGPAFTFTYPYVEESFDNGYRDTRIICQTNISTNQKACTGQRFIEKVNNFFEGWSEGNWHLGMAGNLTIGVDLGTSFENQITFEIGYFFFYFPDGLQLMEPYKNTGFTVIDSQTEDGVKRTLERSTGQESFFEKQSYFGSPQIKFTYSWWW